GPIIKNKNWCFGAFNPQRRRNFYLTQTFHNPAENKVTIPFYAGKITWAPNSKNTLTGSTFGDFTKIDGFQATGALTNASGFGSDINAFQGLQQTGGHNYTIRLNSTIRNNFIAEITGGLHFQRNNTIPRSVDQPLISDNFAVVRGGAVLGVTSTGVNTGFTTNAQVVACQNEVTNGLSRVDCPPNLGRTGFVDFVDGRGGSLQRNFLRGPGFGLFGNQNRDRMEINAHLQNIAGKHTVKYGFEAFRVKYNIKTISTGAAVTYANPLGLNFASAGNNATNGVRIANAFAVCTTRGAQIVCPASAATALLTFPGVVLPTGLTSVVTGSITADEFTTN